MLSMFSNQHVTNIYGVPFSNYWSLKPFSCIWISSFHCNEGFIFESFEDSDEHRPKFLTVGLFGSPIEISRVRYTAGCLPILWMHNEYNRAMTRLVFTPFPFMQPLFSHFSTIHNACRIRKIKWVSNSLLQLPECKEATWLNSRRLPSVYSL